MTELKEEILSQYAAKATLEADIPRRLHIGAFSVNVDKLRGRLIDKRLQMANSLLEMHVRRLRTQTEDLLDEFRRIFQRLTLEPINVEQLFDQREWMETLPVVVAEHSETLQKLKIEYDMLDAFLWNLSDDDFQAKWEAAKYPRKIQIQVDQLAHAVVS